MAARSTSMASPVIEIESLAKSYGSVRALDGLTLAIEPGPVGLLGPNGSGKTTLLKLLLGLLRPDSGRARIAGFDPSVPRERLDLRRAIGYMPEGDCLIPGMTAVELVGALARITGLSAQDAMTRAHEVLDYVGLDEARYRATDEYSTGMKQRLKLAQALVHDPQLLLLDEPTNGLDPKGRRHMLDVIYDLGHAQKKSLLLCSHLLPDVERTCRDVIVLRGGRAVLTGGIDELTRAKGRRLRLRVEGLNALFLQSLARENIAFVEEGESVCVELSGVTADADPLFAIAHATGARLTSVAELRSSLEDVFLEGLSKHDL